MKIAFVFWTFFLFGSCSTQKNIINDYSKAFEPTDKDYIDHLASAGPVFLANTETKTIPLSKESTKFLETIYDRIVLNNEIIFNTQERPRFYFIVSKTPMLFSLPRSQFYISSGLVEKYLKSEEIFVAAIAGEIIKSQRNIYEKRMMVPVGNMTFEKMAKLSRLKLESRISINEWAFYVLKRAGFDASAYLNWIQVQNRNTLDFSFMLGDSIGISKEEQVFKNFLSKQGVASVEKKISEANSSKPFYKLLNNVVSNL